MASSGTRKEFGWVIIQMLIKQYYKLCIVVDSEGIVEYQPLTTK
jgi:hypothetical protein